MLRIQESKVYTDGTNYVSCYCLSTDTKPTNVATGSVAREIDTGKEYYYNEATSTWVEVSFNGGGGGGGSDMPVATITFSVTGKGYDNNLSLIPVSDDDGHITALYKNSNKYYMDLPLTPVAAGSSAEYQIAMFDNSFGCIPSHEEDTATVSGSATIGEDYIITVTGDCTITVDGSK